jgi:hypothetical protein
MRRPKAEKEVDFRHDSAWTSTICFSRVDSIRGKKLILNNIKSLDNLRLSH